jgi:hypothetical protein
MLKQNFGSLSSADAESVSLEPRLGDAGLAADTATPDPSVRDQLARDIADIESATAALLKAEPELESWSEADAPAAYKPRPVWLIIGVLWLSTVLVTAGAVVAIATLAG